ncbi:unnamed protein product [Cladocopium goreaui]|uniref:Synaptotagmin-4 n=1 Tax=Cladocopium goreaui TaxID=2562237 RepID=A0A9P1BJT4_9DINO|nr:unnamed protein product [Cladocopium goreaui]
MEAIADQPEPLPGYAYASCVNMGQPQLGQKMVTHSWRNKFSFLLAAIIADALDSQLYDSVMQLLKDQKFEELCEALNRRMKLDVAYWVCAFSVNQHAGICASPDARDSTGHSIQPCSCCTAKHFQGDLSETNKFDHMMALLKFRLRQDFSEVRLEQVVAMEPDFSLLTRIWCIAELVEAKKLHLPQAIMIHSAASRTDCLKRLFELDVRDANASFPADKDVVETFALRGSFMAELRDDRQHSFFKGLDVADPASVQALESNQEFLMEMICEYWVWATCEEEDAQRRVESVGITSRGAGAGKIAGNLVLEPQNR